MLSTKLTLCRPRQTLALSSREVVGNVFRVRMNFTFIPEINYFREYGYRRIAVRDADTIVLEAHSKIHSIAFLVALSMRYQPPRVETMRSGALQQLREGVRYIRGSRPMVGMLAVTVIMNLWAFPFAAMVPVIGRDVLDISALPIGVLLSAEGAGAFVGALIIAALVRPARFNRIYLSGSFLMLASIIVFSFSSLYTVSLAVLFIAGLGAAGFSAMQTAIMFTLAPPEMRGRVMGVLSVCIGASPLGMLHIGLMARWLSVPTAVLLVAVEGLFALALAAFLWRDSRGN